MPADGVALLGTRTSAGTLLTMLGHLIAGSVLYIYLMRSWHESAHLVPFVRGIYRSLVDSPHKWPVMRSFDIFFDVSSNELLNKQWRGGGYIVLKLIWRHWNDYHRMYSSADADVSGQLFRMYTYRAECSGAFYCPASRTTLVATRFRVAVICPIIQVPHCIRVFFYFVWFVFINHIFQFYYELCTYCNILDIYLS